MDLTNDNEHHSVSPNTIGAVGKPANEKEVEEKGHDLKELCKKFTDKVNLPESVPLHFCFLSSND
jgi:hypothetical protein